MPLPSRVLLTGVTGFVGQALLEQLLATTGAHVHVLVRPRGSLSGADRFRRLLTKSVFDPLRAEYGEHGLVRLAQERVTVLEGDLRDVPALPSDLDVVLHSASSVTFDEPQDAAFRTNVGGPAALYAALHQAGGNPHVVHVSTSYVWTGRTDVGRETSVEHDVDWRAELADVLAERDRLAGTLEGAALTDALRTAGHDRARSHGWTDVYTMTKALGERVAEQEWAARGGKLTVVRPTIIESALTVPFPGWIDGFKVADPLIAAYAKGKLAGFPGRADAVLDVVPVDQVVATTLLAARVAPAVGTPRYLQVGTGMSNPLTLGELRLHVQGYFAEHPWVDRDGVAVRPIPWEFGEPVELRRKVDRRLALLEGARRSLRFARVPARRSIERLDALRHALTTMRRFIDIYEPYTCATTVYDDAATRELHRRAGGWQVPVIDWTDYLRDHHLPALVELMRGGRAKRSSPDGGTARAALRTRGREPGDPHVGRPGRPAWRSEGARAAHAAPAERVRA